LLQLTDEYNLVKENLARLQRFLKQKSENLPDLRAAAAEAEQRHQEAQKTASQKTKVKELKLELGWAHVKAKKEASTCQTYITCGANCS
jgi:structural maintenance of chromosomes protein 6